MTQRLRIQWAEPETGIGESRSTCTRGRSAMMPSGTAGLLISDSSRMRVAVPAQVWPFAGVSYMQMPGRFRILLPLSEDGIYRKRFSNTNINLCYGLAFHWPAPRSAS
jgi:hypothetical protein